MKLRLLDNNCNTIGTIAIVLSGATLLKSKILPKLSLLWKKDMVEL